MPGAISLSSSSHFSAQTVFEHRKIGNVAAQPRQAIDVADADWIRDDHEYNRHGACCPDGGDVTSVAYREPNL
jgi:hypothetical protein